MEQIILPLTVLEFAWLVIEGFMEENGLVPSPKKDISSLQYRTLFEIHSHYFSLFFIYRKFSSPTLKKSSPQKVPISTQNLNLTQVPTI